MGSLLFWWSWSKRSSDWANAQTPLDQSDFSWLLLLLYLDGWVCFSSLYLFLYPCENKFLVGKHIESSHARTCTYSYLNIWWFTWDVVVLSSSSMRKSADSGGRNMGNRACLVVIIGVILAFFLWLDTPLPKFPTINSKPVDKRYNTSLRIFVLVYLR